MKSELELAEVCSSLCHSPLRSGQGIRWNYRLLGCWERHHILSNPVNLGNPVNGVHCVSQ